MQGLTWNYGGNQPLIVDIRALTCWVGGWVRSSGVSTQGIGLMSMRKQDTMTLTPMYFALRTTEVLRVSFNETGMDMPRSTRTYSGLGTPNDSDSD